MVVALITDIVGSRGIANRAAAQRVLDEVIGRVTRDQGDVIEPLHPIVGDEWQGVYPTLVSALRATLLLQLGLPDGIECRFGLGIGDIGVIPSASGDISDGPAWWAARDAIEAVEGLSRRAAPASRTRVAAAVGEGEVADAQVRFANAYLLTRDEIVGAMTERTRRLTYGRCQGVTQAGLADAEGITQSAVSQALSAGGAHAVVEGFRLLGE